MKMEEIKKLVKATGEIGLSYLPFIYDEVENWETLQSYVGTYAPEKVYYRHGKFVFKTVQDAKDARSNLADRYPSWRVYRRGRRVTIAEGNRRGWKEAA